MPLVSFVIPTLNEEKVIAKLIANLKQIKEFSYEIIVSDGGSTDKTLEQAKSADVLVTHNLSKRQTIGEGRNAGAKKAQGEFLVFLDADVSLENPDEFFKKAFQDFQNKKNLVGLGGFLKVLPELETWADVVGYNIFSNYSFYLNNNILKVGGNCGEFGMMKKVVFDSLGGYKENIVAGEDLELFRRLAKKGDVFTDPELTVFHTGRRPHTLGWPKLYWRWIKEFWYVTIFHRSSIKEWEVIR